MTVKSAPYYWAECDGHLCFARIPDEDSDTIALVSIYTVHNRAREDGWRPLPDGRWLCPTCQLDEEDGDG